MRKQGRLATRAYGAFTSRRNWFRAGFLNLQSAPAKRKHQMFERGKKNRGSEKDEGRLGFISRASLYMVELLEAAAKVHLFGWFPSDEGESIPCMMQSECGSLRHFGCFSLNHQFQTSELPWPSPLKVVHIHFRRRFDNLPLWLSVLRLPGGRLRPAVHPPVLRRAWLGLGGALGGPAPGDVSGAAADVSRV